MPNIHPDLTLSFTPISWGLLVIRKFKPSGQSDEQRVGPSAVSWEARYQGFRMSSLSLGYICLSAEPGEEKSGCVDFLIKSQRWSHRVHKEWK
jgi:hypothetical protein